MTTTRTVPVPPKPTMAIIDANGSACSKIGGVASVLHDLAPRRLVIACCGDAAKTEPNQNSQETKVRGRLWRRWDSKPRLPACKAFRLSALANPGLPGHSRTWMRKLRAVEMASLDEHGPGPVWRCHPVGTPVNHLGQRQSRREALTERVELARRWRGMQVGRPELGAGPR